jgi:hypothetical protein
VIVDAAEFALWLSQHIVTNINRILADLFKWAQPEIDAYLKAIVMAAEHSGAASCLTSPGPFTTNAIGFADPGPGCRSPGTGSYEEDGCTPGDCLWCWRLQRYKDWPRKGRAVRGRSCNWPAFRAGREALALGGRW